MLCWIAHTHLCGAVTQNPSFSKTFARVESVCLKRDGPRGTTDANA